MLHHKENRLGKRQVMRVIKNKYHKLPWYVAENYVSYVVSYPLFL
jgi:hypothetical protein